MSLGSFLKRVTTIPSHGPLSPLRSVFGKTPLDEIGAVGGFMLGGPAGAAAGSGLGSLAHGSSVGSALGNAAKYGAAGIGANAALGAAGGGIQGAMASLGHDLGPLSGLAKGMGGAGSLAQGIGTAGNSGGLLGQIGSFLTHNPELALGAIGALSNAKQASGAGDLRNQAVNLVMQDYNDRKPFRDLALQRLSTLGQTPAVQMPTDPNPYAHAVGRL